jgi:predicted RNA-binding protein with RPS1 domain
MSNDANDLSQVSNPRSENPASAEIAAASTDADQPKTSTAEPEQDSTADGKVRPPRIRIGSQRYSAATQYPSKLEDLAPPATEVPPAQVPPVGVSAVGVPASAGLPPVSAPVVVAASPVQPPAPSAPAARAPRVAVPASAGPSPTSAPSKKYPPPNLREQLPTDLEQELHDALGDMSLDDMLAGPVVATGADLEPESRHQVRVVSLHRDNVFVELPGHEQGVISLRQFPEPPKPGATLEVMVQRFNAEEGLYELLLPNTSVSVGDWSEVSEGMVVDAQITGQNKGGLECQVNHLRGFIPAGQVSLYRVEDLGQFVGQRFPCVVTEANAERRNLVLSRRALLEREQTEAKQKLLAELAPGQIREGVVRSLRDFGAFVDLGGVDGLLHVSQLSWSRVKHPSEVLECGQKVQVKIEKVDPDTGKISLGYRELTESPWSKAAGKYPPRTQVTGTVSKLMDFGAFVQLEPGIEGLVHISELSHKRVWRASDVVSEGQEVEVQVLSVDQEAQRISLSIKALQARSEPAKKAEPEPEEPQAPAFAPKHKGPLKGGLGRGSGGDQFGLKW